MSWQFTDDPDAFADRVWDLLAADPVASTVPLTVTSAARGGRRWSDDPMLFGWHEDGGAVLMTPPHELLLARVPEGTLADLVNAMRGFALPGVNGEAGLAERFAAAWPEEHTVFLQLRLYGLGTLVPPDPPPPGAARVARGDELEVAARWLAAFEEETGVTRTDTHAGARERGEDGRLWLWEDADGRPVSLAARTPAAVGVARIAPVYTPPEHRRRGYGAAITAACSADALARDADHVVLFADADNPTTNAIYQQIGFRPVSDWSTLRFTLMRSGDEYRREAVAALRVGDGRLGHDWAKGWVGSGGGARTVEPWLVYLAAALLEGQRRIGVHAVDLALRHWIEDDFARAVLLYARGEAIRRQLGDPKTAQADLDAAAAHAPGWLRPALDAAPAACADEARTSRRRKPTVDPAPAFTGTETEVAPSQPDGRLANAPPGVWDEVLRVLTAADPRALSGRP